MAEKSVMTVEEYLGQYLKIEDEIQREKEHIASLRSIVENTTTHLSFTAGRNPSKDNGKFENTMLDIVEAERKYDEKLRDLGLKQAEIANLINRVPDETFESKVHKNVGEKRKMAEKARSLIRSGFSIALGSGTSVFALANLLDDLSSGIIYTNSMQAADYLCHCSNLDVHISSGIIRGRTGTIIGIEATEYFRTLKNIDFAFIGCDAIDSRGNVLSDNLSVAAVEKHILLSAKHKYILCDSSKLGQTAVASICSLSQCDGLISCPSSFPAKERYGDLTRLLFA